jgi:4-hydroxyphenylpyruvate dioxygenase
MKMSIATVSLSGLLADKLYHAKAAHFDTVEIFENDLLSAPERPTDISRILRDLDLRCAMLQPFRDYEGMPADLKARALERFRRKFQVMDELGTDMILLCSNCSPQSAGERQRMLDDLGAAAELAAAHGKRIAYEALAWGRYVNDHRDAWALVRDVNHPALGLCLDTFHSLARDIPVSSLGDIRPEKLFIVQVADAPRIKSDLLEWSRHFRCMPGQGDFDLEAYCATLLKIGYDGLFSLEIFNDRFRASSAAEIARDGHRSLTALSDKIERNPNSPGGQPATVTGIEFIEFAASHTEAEDFGRMFRALGFVPVARHRSKEVVRWKHGGVNLIMNSEPEGLAHSFNVTHGGSVCAIGLKVESQGSVLSRAQALSVQQYETNPAPDEWNTPSLRAVGGSLIYLVDSATTEAMWRAEFPHALESEPSKRDLTVVDHIAQTMQYEEFLSWLLYYTSMFDMTKTPQLEIADPMGIVYSQAVESRDKSVRFTLNGSMSANALSTRFLHNYFGAGVQHIAFLTTDIFAAAKSAKVAGLPLLEISPNYYDDLEARFDLPAELVARMSEHNILYDRDGGGEYFQFYSRAVSKRVFFEVVERRDYGAYGAVNASVRLNAQARFRDPAGL